MKEYWYYEERDNEMNVKGRIKTYINSWQEIG